LLLAGLTHVAGMTAADHDPAGWNCSTTEPDQMVSVRYIVDDIEASIAFYTTHLGFEVRTSAAPAFADVARGTLRLLLSGPASSARRPMADATTPIPGGWNRIYLIVADIHAEVDRLRDAGLRLRNYIVTGPTARQPSDSSCRLTRWAFTCAPSTARSGRGWSWRG